MGSIAAVPNCDGISTNCITICNMNSQKYIIDYKTRAITKREEEVLTLVLAELTSQEIALNLSLSAETVKTHRKNIAVKLGVRGTIGMVLWALRIGLRDKWSGQIEEQAFTNGQTGSTFDTRSGK